MPYKLAVETGNEAIGDYSYSGTFLHTLRATGLLKNSMECERCVNFLYSERQD